MRCADAHSVEGQGLLELGVVSGVPELIQDPTTCNFCMSNKSIRCPTAVGSYNTAHKSGKSPGFAAISRGAEPVEGGNTWLGCMDPDTSVCTSYMSIEPDERPTTNLESFDAKVMALGRHSAGTVISGVNAMSSSLSHVMNAFLKAESVPSLIPYQKSVSYQQR